jgi:hypothetical protein
LKKEQTRVLRMETTHNLRKFFNRHDPNMKKVYIERKYNTKLAYQMQSLIQAKDIENTRYRVNQKLAKGQESPLIRNVLKFTRTERKAVDCKPKMNNYFKQPSEFEGTVPFEIMECRHMLHNLKLR